MKKDTDVRTRIFGDFHYHRVSGREAAILMLLAVVVGIASGLSAIILNISVHKAIHLLEHYHKTLLMVVLPAIGAALSAIFLRYILKDPSGHGVPDLIKASTIGGGKLRLDMIYSRLVSSFLTVSSGGSAGLEGPIATSGGAIGSALGRLFSYKERWRTLLLGYGVAGAIAAIFNAPLTGTVFALEVILGEWSAMSILPTIVSAVTATQFSRIIMGNRIEFTSQTLGFGTHDLLVFILLGVTNGILAVVFSRSLMSMEHFFEEKLTWPVWVKASIGGLFVGTAGYFMPEVLHDGYFIIKEFLSGSDPFIVLSHFVPVSIVTGDSLFTAKLAGLAGILFFIVLKLMAVNFTLSSGGSGGVFAPSLVLGSAVGYGFGTFLQFVIPGLKFSSPATYALVGMTGMVTGLMHAPLTGIFLVLEVTGGYGMILPLMITSVSAMLVSYYFDVGSIYTKKLMARGLMARKGSDLHLLQTMKIRELIDNEVFLIREDMLLKDFIEVFKNARRNLFPVVDPETNTWQGVVYLDDIRPYLFSTSLYSIMTMGEVMHHDLPTIEAEESPLAAIEKFEESGAWTLPVVDQGKYVGMMSKSTLFDRYRRELIVHTH